jgi:hypothetical protein
VLNKQDVPALGSKINVRPFAGNMFTVVNSFGQRVESIRSADDLHPTFETTNKMAYMVRSDSTYDLGAPWWNTEIWDPSWKIGDQHSFSDRWLFDAYFGHHCWCNSIVPQTEELRQLQPMLELTTGTWGRSWSDSAIMLVTNNTFDANTSCFHRRAPRWGSLLQGRLQMRALPAGLRSPYGHAQSVFDSASSLPIFRHAVHRASCGTSSRGAFDQHSLYVQDAPFSPAPARLVGLR